MQIGESIFLAIQIWRSAPAVLCATRHRVANVLERPRRDQQGEEA
jgi:hypothetical protein